MKNQILASITRAFAPSLAGYSNHYRFTVTAQAYLLGGNQHPHFSVTAEVTHKASGSVRAAGCMHDEAANAWPAIAPIIALHLSNADDGEPMHAEGNGFYSIAGSVAGNFGEQYHAGNSARNFPIKPDPATPWKDTESRNPTQDECLAFCAAHLRAPLADVRAVRDRCLAAFAAGADSVAPKEADDAPTGHKMRAKAGNAAAKAVFAEYVATLRPQWKQEAKDGIALIRDLKAKQEAKKAEKLNA